MVTLLSQFTNRRFTTRMCKHFKRILLRSKLGCMSYRDCVNLEIYDSSLIQFRKIYNQPVRSIYKQLWCPICH